MRKPVVGAIPLVLWDGERQKFQAQEFGLHELQELNCESSALGVALFIGCELDENAWMEILPELLPVKLDHVSQIELPSNHIPNRQQKGRGLSSRKSVSSPYGSGNAGLYFWPRLVKLDRKTRRSSNFRFWKPTVRQTWGNWTSDHAERPHVLRS